MEKPAMFVWEEYSPSPFVTMHAARIRHADVVRILEELRKLRPSDMKLQEVGKSYEGRSIYCVTIGRGPIKIFAWSQMHGNEPTHTAVLLDLIDLLLRHPERQVCKDILSQCTLVFVPMLNPDGAERYIRRTAQDIDMNRDALHLATPEGRLLRQLVESIRPEFAFNLHNQQAGTSVDGFKPAVVSLLVPPIDSADTQTEWTQKAKQVAAVMREAIEPYCEGMISRYDADYMPRCFGEWVQQQEIATLTIEAGGWSTVDTQPLVQLHFLGMINALECIANGCYVNAEAEDYDSLPRSSDQNVFDVMVRSTKVVPGGGRMPFEADLGINFKFQDRSVPVERRGSIDDFGDLCLTGGKHEIASSNLLCVPGKIVFSPSVSPKSLPTDLLAKEFLSQGVTTLIGRLNLADDAEIEALVQLSPSVPRPINFGFLASAVNLDHSELDERLTRAVAAGILGYVTDGKSNPPTLLDWFEVPILKTEELPSPDKQSPNIHDLVDATYDIATKLGLASRASIKIGTAADMVFYPVGAVESLLTIAPERVMLGGKIVLENGQFKQSVSGEFLRRSI